MIGENEKEVHSIKNFVSSLKIMVLKIMITVMVTMITMITMITMMMMMPNHLPEGEDLKVGGIACPETFTLLSPEEPIWR